MEQRIKNFHNVMGLRIIIASTILGGIFIAVSFNSGQMMTVIAVCAAFFALGAMFLCIGQIRERGLARLRAEGAAYDADSIDYAPVYWISTFWLRDYAVFRAYFSYTDHRGVLHATKTRWYAMKLDKKETHLTPLDNFGFSAKVYVNPGNLRDYAMELHVED